MIGILFNFFRLDPISTEKPNTEVLRSVGDESEANISLTFVFFTLFVAGTTHNSYVLKALYHIYSNSQPMFLVFAFTVAGALFYGLITLIKALGYLITVPFCTFWGIAQISCFSYISIFVALICFCRAVAVSYPLRYKCLMSMQTIKRCIIFCLTFSILISLAICLITDLKFVYYHNEDGRVGCIPSLDDDGIFRLSTGFVVGIFGFDLAIVVTYAVLHKSFNKYCTRKSMRELKKIVFKITISTTITYVLCFLPTFIVYSMILLSFLNVTEMLPRVFLSVDAVLAFFAHFYAAILPIVLIYSKCLRKGKQIKHSEHISSNVFMRKSHYF